MKKLTEKQQANIYGGAATLAAIGTLAPIVISGITAIAHIIKMFTSRSGENKIGTSSVKWNNDPTKAEIKPVIETRTIYVSY